MEFGLQFFPNFTADQKSACEYWNESLHLAGLCDELGLSHVRSVEHHFHPYGGYSPNPLIFLSAVAARTERPRLITGAVLPVFNHPLKLAGEIGMLDAISSGRAEIGFARAFLPQEFRHFGVSLDESRSRFEEGVLQIQLLLENETASHSGRYHAFDGVTCLPRSTQKPRPPFWVAALNTPSSFTWAGEHGFFVMAVPMTGGALRERLEMYREAWRAAGHPGDGKVMLAFHMFCHEQRETAIDLARGPLERYLALNVDAASSWLSDETSDDYPNYDRVIARLQQQTFDSQRELNVAWVGTPKDLVEMIHELHRDVGPYDVASLQINFNDLDVEVAEASIRLFAHEVMPHFVD